MRFGFIHLSPNPDAHGVMSTSCEGCGAVSVGTLWDFVLLRARGALLWFFYLSEKGVLSPPGAEPYVTCWWVRQHTPWAPPEEHIGGAAPGWWRAARSELKQEPTSCFKLYFTLSKYTCSWLQAMGTGTSLDTMVVRNGGFGMRKCKLKSWICHFPLLWP